MYIKFVNKNINEIGVGLHITEQIYECDHFDYQDAIQPELAVEMAIVPENHAQFILYTNDQPVPKYIEIDKERTTAYVMNVNGKTIDTYTWRTGENRIVRL